MQDNPSEQSRRIPPPVLTRVMPEPHPGSVPLMPPFVPCRAAAGGGLDRMAPEPIPIQELPTAPAAALEPMPWESAPETAAPAVTAAASPEEELWPLLSEHGSAEPAWDNGEEISGGPADFPLDAFIIPEDTQRLPSGYEAEQHALAERVASRLDELARQVRTGGLAQLGTAPTTDELTRLLAAVVTGYVGRGGDP